MAVIRFVTLVNKKLVMLVLLATIVLLAGCRSSWDADTFIANTVDGRAGEIRSALRDDLPAADKATFGTYMAGIEPLIVAGRALLPETQALQLSSRGTPADLAEAHFQLVSRWRLLGGQIDRLDPPSSLAQAHDSVRAAYRAAALATEEYASALAVLDFQRLRPAGQQLMVALDSAGVAMDDFETRSEEYLRAGKRLRLQ